MFMKHEDYYRKPKLDHKLHTSINHLDTLREYGKSSFRRTPGYKAGIGIRDLGRTQRRHLSQHFRYSDSLLQLLSYYNLYVG